MTYQKFLTQTLKEASKIANQMFGKVTATIKDHDPKQVLTEADGRIGKFIINEIEENFPTHNIVDEEAGVIDKKSEFTWVVDPIDGTVNFAHGSVLFGIMVGLLQGEMPVAGAVSLPKFDEVYVAEKDKGAFCNGKRIEINRAENQSSHIITFKLIGEPGNFEFIEKQAKYEAAIANEFIHMRENGSVYDTMMLAKGVCSGELNLTCKIWDNVAQHIIVEEAGGVYTDFYGQPMDYSKALSQPDSNYTYCSAAASVHKKLQEIIHSVDSGFPPEFTPYHDTGRE